MSALRGGGGHHRCRRILLMHVVLIVEAAVLVLILLGELILRLVAFDPPEVGADEPLGCYNMHMPLGFERLVDLAGSVFGRYKMGRVTPLLPQTAFTWRYKRQRLALGPAPNAAAGLIVLGLAATRVAAAARLVVAVLVIPFRLPFKKKQSNNKYIWLGKPSLSYF